MAESPVSNHNLRKCGVFADKKSIDMFHSLHGDIHCTCTCTCTKIENLLLP